VKLSYRLLAFMMVLVGCMAAWAAPVPKDKEKEHEGQKVDAGSFGVFQNGHRVGTETFSIYQTGSGSVIDSEFKTEGSPTPAVQSSEMQLNSKGEIRRYEWKELSPGSAQSVIVPNDDFLNEKWSAGPEDKEHEQPYLLSPATSILDDYFFIHRELLIWKFVALTCSKKDNGMVQCPPKQHTQFPTLNPHQHSSAGLSVESIGREKVSLKSGVQELNKLEIKSESGTWQIWLNDQWMVMKMSVVGENTEVVRD
jgi:hypothetical protein